MEPILAAIVSALVAGAAAKAKDVAAKGVSDAYDGLKSLLMRQLGKSGAVQSVEDEPDSESASVTLTEAMAKQKLAQDTELASLADKLVRALHEAKTAGVPGVADIEIDTVRGRINATIDNLVAAGRIKLGPVIAEQ